MAQDKIQKIKALKDKFKKLRPKEREQVSVNFLKVKLGVHHPDEFDAVMNFLGDFELDINPENLDSMMNYLHASSHSLPEFIAMEDSVNQTQSSITLQGLEPYDPDDAETLKDQIKPFKD